MEPLAKIKWLLALYKSSGICEMEVICQGPDAILGLHTKKVRPNSSSVYNPLFYISWSHLQSLGMTIFPVGKGFRGDSTLMGRV